MISHTVKNQEFKDHSGGGASQFSEQSAASITENDIVQHLMDEGIHDPQTMLALQHKPLAELQAISGYLDKQTNIRSRPGLFAWLVQQDFGAKLLAGRHQKVERRKGRSKRSMCMQPELVDLMYEQERESLPAELAVLWQQVRDRVSSVLPRDIFDVWIKPTTLLMLDTDCAVVGTPNLFVREEVNQQYREHLENAFTELCGRPIELEAVIG